MRALLVASILAAPAIASAGTYIGAAVGPGLDGGGDLSTSTDGRAYKGILGYSIGQISIEGIVQRGSMAEDSGRDYDVTQLAVAGKYSLPLADGFEAFGRIGYGRTWLSSQQANDDTANGNGDGWLVGGGVEYRLKLVATQASIFLDYDVMTASLNGHDFSSTSFNARGFTIGATIGF